MEPAPHLDDVLGLDRGRGLAGFLRDGNGAGAVEDAERLAGAGAVDDRILDLKIQLFRREARVGLLQHFRVSEQLFRGVGQDRDLVRHQLDVAELRRALGERAAFLIAFSWWVIDFQPKVWSASSRPALATAAILPPAPLVTSSPACVSSDSTTPPRRARSAFFLALSSGEVAGFLAGVAAAMRD